MFDSSHRPFARAELLCASSAPHPLEAICNCSTALSLDTCSSSLDIPTSRTWRVSSLDSRGLPLATLSHFRELVHPQPWWVSRSRLAFSFQLFDQHGAFRFCFRRFSSPHNYGLFRCSETPPEDPVALLPSRPSSESPLLIVRRLDATARAKFSAGAGVSPISSIPWSISPGPPISSSSSSLSLSPVELALLLARFANHMETSLLSDSEGRLL
ncbi:MAG: hypothetical protein Q8P67_17405 [archaeon]|nr:hypothetical protein [archaeon]